MFPFLVGTYVPKVGHWTLDVPELVVMEATLVSNETLAHLSIMNNLERFTCLVERDLVFGREDPKQNWRQNRRPHEEQ
jgi:hypothetical protein